MIIDGKIFYESGFVQSDKYFVSGVEKGNYKFFLTDDRELYFTDLVTGNLVKLETDLEILQVRPAERFLNNSQKIYFLTTNGEIWHCYISEIRTDYSPRFSKFDVGDIIFINTIGNKFLLIVNRNHEASLIYIHPEESTKEPKRLVDGVTDICALPESNMIVTSDRKAFIVSIDDEQYFFKEICDNVNLVTGSGKIFHIYRDNQTLSQYAIYHCHHNNKIARHFCGCDDLLTHKISGLELGNACHTQGTYLKTYLLKEHKLYLVDLKSGKSAHIELDFNVKQFYGLDRGILYLISVEGILYRFSTNYGLSKNNIKCLNTTGTDFIFNNENLTIFRKINKATKG